MRGLLCPTAFTVATYSLLSVSLIFLGGEKHSVELITLETSVGVFVSTREPRGNLPVSQNVKSGLYRAQTSAPE